MNDAYNENRDALPEATQSVLREMYAPPADPGYWDLLEARILARVRREGAVAWWTQFPDWMRVGMAAAAAAAILLMGVVWFQDRRSDQRLAEERLLQPLIDEVPVLVESMADEPRRTRDATLRHIITR